MSSPRESPQPTKQQKLQPILGVIPVHHFFAATSVLLLVLYQWPLRWLISGAPLLTFSILLGASRGHRILPIINLFVLISFINLYYAVAATSWLLYWIYFTACYPGIFLSCLFQFDLVGKYVRRTLRNVLRELEFTNDCIAFFDLPALEIDVDVEGLMCIRGITFSLSSLKIIAHGIEVGIKFSDDLELALVTDRVEILLFRRIDVSDVYGNIKGGDLEISLGKLADKSRTPTGTSLMSVDTPLLAAAAERGDTRSPVVAMAEKMTDGAPPKEDDIGTSLKSIRQISPDDEFARKTYQAILDYIDESSVIRVCRNEVEATVREKLPEGETLDNAKDRRAAICSQLHTKPTIPHPAKRSIKVSALKTMSPPSVRRFLHRLPMLLRLLLNPIAYFHPVFIRSITAGGSGAWIEWMLHEQIFKEYPDQDSDVRNLKKRIRSWLTDANFVFEAYKITGMASVPMNPIYDIISNLMFDDLMFYRTVRDQVDYTQIVHLAGADARITLPSYLLPHHEHLLPPVPTSEDEAAGQKKVDDADSQPKTIQAEQELKQLRKDETNFNISTHVRLPACFDQELLDFIAALVKATKIIEMGKGGKELDKDLHGFKEFTKAVKQDLNSKMRKVAIDAAANDKWIAKLVGKVTKQLEQMQGDIGYSGDVPIPLEIYRKNAESASKLLP